MTRYRIKVLLLFCIGLGFAVAWIVMTCGCCSPPLEYKYDPLVGHSYWLLPDPRNWVHDSKARAARTKPVPVQTGTDNQARHGRRAVNQ